MSKILVVAELQREAQEDHPQRDHLRARRRDQPFDILVLGAGRRAPPPRSSRASARAASSSPTTRTLRQLRRRGLRAHRRRGREERLRRRGVTASAFGKDLAPRVAARSEAGSRATSPASRLVGRALVQAPDVRRQRHRDHAVTTAVQVVTVRQSEFEPLPPAADRVAVSKVAREAPPRSGSSS
jgi:electron transfer flavoprotein alpha subunit